jgi:hypothetical protein
MSKGIVTFVLMGGLLLAPPVLGDSKTDDHHDVPVKRQLEQHAGRLDREIHSGAKNRSRADLVREKREVDDMIRRLEAGGNVSPQEVHQLLEH